MDRTRKGRSSRGERHPDAKLNPDAIRMIRARAAAGEAQTELAQEFGVAPATVNSVVARKTWKHVS